MTSKTVSPKRKTTRRRTVSQAELKRQLKALKLENTSLKLAKNSPVIPTGISNTEDMEHGQQGPREMSSTGTAKESLEPINIEAIDSRSPSMEKLEALAFSEEVLTVVVHQTTNETEVPLPVVWNDGRAQYFIRGQAQKVKMKFVEILARCRVTTFVQEAYKDGAGNDSYRHVPNTAHMYPFSVTNDPSGPRGAKWLEDIMSEPI